MTYPNVQLLIDGQWCDAASKKTLPVMNPATGETIGTVAHAEKTDLDRALEAAAKGFQAWRKVGSLDRYKVMRKAADLLRERADRVATLMTMEQGKPLAEAKIEVMMGADTIDWFAEEGRRAYGRVVPARAPGIYQLVIKEAVGPVAAFTPWNFPINQIVRKLSAAEAHNDGLQSINCTIEKFHKFTSINSDCDGVWVQKKPPYTAAASQSADGPELLAVPPFQHSQRKNFAPCFTQSAVYFPCKFFGFPVRGRGIMFCDPLAQHRSGNDCPVDFFLILEIIRKCPFVRVSHRSRSFLYGRFILRKNLPPTAQCRRGQRVRPPLSRAAFSGAGTTGSCPHQNSSSCRRRKGIYSGGDGTPRTCKIHLPPSIVAISSCDINSFPNF